MGPALLVFLMVAGAIVGGYVAVTRLPGALATRRLDQRLRDVSMPAWGSNEELEETVIKPHLEGPLPALDRMVASSWMQRLIEQSGVNTTPSALLLISIAVAAALGFTTYLMTSRVLIPILFIVAGLALPTLYLFRRRITRFKKFEEQFPEALDLLSRAIRAGHAFQTAMGMVADELPPPVGPEFRKTYDRQNFGLPLRDALNELTERVSLLDVRFFVTAVLIQRETGGNLAEILDNLAGVVRERFKILRQVRVHTAHGRFTGYVLLALPAALGVALVFINPDLMRLLFQERMGHMLLAGAMVLQTVGFFWIRAVVKIEV
jgi:tight adherence protein B